MLSSFLQHNPWFDGDIVIFHDELPATVQTRLARFRNIRYRAVGSSDLASHLDRVLARNPKLLRKRFLALEAFDLVEYERVVYLDSDLLCRGEASALFQCDIPLGFAPDQTYFREEVRDAKTFVPLPAGDAVTGSVLDGSFNCGVMTWSPRLLGRETYARLLEQITPALWTNVRTGHTNSVLLNLHFAGKWTVLPERYNHLVSNTSARYTRKRSSIEEAVLIHFLGNPKPWQIEPADIQKLDPERARAFAWWRAASALLA